MLSDAIECPVLSLSDKHDVLGTDPIIDRRNGKSEYVVRRAHWNKKTIPMHDNDRLLLVARNPLDVAVSCFFHFTFNKASINDLDYCVDQVCGLRAGPHLAFDDSRGRLGWASYNREWMDQGVPFVRYTDFHENARSMLRKTLDNLCVPIKPGNIDRSVEWNTYQNTVKYRPLFVRKGEIGGYKDILSAQNVDTIYRHCGGLMKYIGYEVP